MHKLDSNCGWRDVKSHHVTSFHMLIFSPSHDKSIVHAKDDCLHWDSQRVEHAVYVWFWSAERIPVPVPVPVNCVNLSLSFIVYTRILVYYVVPNRSTEEEKLILETSNQASSFGTVWQYLRLRLKWHVRNWRYYVSFPTDFMYSGMRSDSFSQFQR